MSSNCGSLKELTQGAVPKGWHKIPLGQLVTFHRGYDLPQKDMIDGQYPVVGSNGIIGYHNTFKVKGPGVAIGRSGNLGKPFFVDKDYWPHNTSLYVSEFHNSDQSFVYYFLKTMHLGEYNAGSAVPTLNRNHIHTIDVVVPEAVEEQKAIGKMLSNLDAKIKLNQQENQVLEAIGQAVFKRWFVDFEFPNQEGKPYRSTGGKMSDSEHGEIPKDWEVKPLGEVIELAYGKPLKENEREAGNIPVYGSNGQIGWHNEGLVKGPGIIVGRKGNPGTVIWSQTDFFPIDTTFYVSPRVASSLHYLFYVLKVQNLPSLSADSAVPGLNRNIAYMNNILMPSSDILVQFSQLIECLYAKIYLNDKESHTLATIRDSLLPKLMSGKIRVPLNKEILEAN